MSRVICAGSLLFLRRIREALLIEDLSQFRGHRRVSFGNQVTVLDADFGHVVRLAGVQRRSYLSLVDFDQLIVSQFAGLGYDRHLSSPDRASIGPSLVEVLRLVGIHLVFLQLRSGGLGL